MPRERAHHSEDPVDEFQLSRREALKVWSLLLGAAVLPSVLTGCEGGNTARTAAQQAAPWAARALSKAQVDMVAAMAEYIIPETDTPGARGARVHEFIDTVVATFMPEKARQRFVAGLDRVDQRAQRAYGAAFLSTTPAQQRELVEALNRTAYADPDAATADARPDETAGGARRRRPAPLQEGELASAAGSDVAAARAAAGPGGAWEPGDVGRESFFLGFKRLVIEGYYTSEVGATRELRLNPMGAWRADVPYAEIGRAYA
jgi:hypothetical protein